MKEIEKLKFLNQLAIKIYAIGAVATLLLALFVPNFFVAVSVGFVSVISALIIRNSLKCPFCGDPILKTKVNQFGLYSWHLHIPPKCSSCCEELKDRKERPKKNTERIRIDCLTNDKGKP